MSHPILPLSIVILPTQDSKPAALRLQEGPGGFFSFVFLSEMHSSFFSATCCAIWAHLTASILAFSALANANVELHRRIAHELQCGDVPSVQKNGPMSLQQGVAIFKILPFN